MKILIFANMYYPFRGGYFESIHGFVKHCWKRGHTVAVITCNTHAFPEKEVMDGVRIFRLRCVNPRFLYSSFPFPLPTLGNIRLLREVLREEWDIFSTQTRFFPLSWIGFFLGKIQGVAVVHTERGATHSITPSHLITWLASTLDHTLGYIIMRYSLAVVAVSCASRDFAQHIGARSPYVIYNGVDASFWGSGSRRDPPRPIITFVGRLIYAKGVQDLLQAVSSLNIEVEVRIIGDGPYRAELEKKAKALANTIHVVFTGELDHRAIHSAFQETTIFVNPSHSEGLPRSVLEAAAAGLPIIATDVGGTREIIQDQISGFLIPPQDINALCSILNRLLQDHTLRKAVGERIQRRACQKFDWENITTAYLKLFESILLSHSHVRN